TPPLGAAFLLLQNGLAVAFTRQQRRLLTAWAAWQLVELFSGRQAFTLVNDHRLLLARGLDGGRLAERVATRCSGVARRTGSAARTVAALTTLATLTFALASVAAAWGLAARRASAVAGSGSRGAGT